MAEIIVFHHAQGLTAGCHALADALRGAGHVVHTPDLYDGQTFEELLDGVAHAERIGFGTVLERGRLAGEALSSDVVYLGLSLGVMSAAMLTMTRPGAKGAVFLHSSVPLEEFGGEWPVGVPLQIHTREDDEWGDADVARGLVDAVEGAELFLYPGSDHLFTDNSLSDYDETAAGLVMERVLRFLDDID